MSAFYVLTGARGYIIVNSKGEHIGRILTSNLDRGVLFNFGDGFIEIPLNDCSDPNTMQHIIHHKMTTKDIAIDESMPLFTTPGGPVDYYPVMCKLFNYETLAHDIFDHIKLNTNTIFQEDVVILQCAGRIFIFRTKIKPLTEIYVDHEKMAIGHTSKIENYLRKVDEVTLESIEDMEERNASSLSRLLLSTNRKLKVHYTRLS